MLLALLYVIIVFSQSCESCKATFGFHCTEYIYNKTVLYFITLQYNLYFFKVVLTHVILSP